MLTVGLEKLVDVGQQLQQSVEVELGGAALQHGEEQHRGLALHPLQRETTRGHRAATVPQLHSRSEERTFYYYLFPDFRGSEVAGVSSGAVLTDSSVLWKSSSFALASEKWR